MLGLAMCAWKLRDGCFHERILCCSVVRSERAFFNSAPSFKYIALLKGMLYHLEMHTALLQRAWCNCSRNTSYFVWILPLQKHTALPQRKITLIQKGMFVLNTAFVGRYGDVVIMLKSSSIFCRNCVLLKGHCSSMYLR